MFKVRLSQGIIVQGGVVKVPKEAPFTLKNFDSSCIYEMKINLSMKQLQYIC
jgi:hypothetical protein